MTITLRDLLARKGDPLQLEPLTGELGLDRPIVDPEVASPGLAREDVAAGTRHQLAWDQLEVLACFRQPRTPTAALAELGQSVQLGADDLRQLLIGMIAAGVLVPTSEPDPVDG